MATIEHVRALGAVTFGLDNLETWLFTPSRHLGGRSPQAAIDDGDTDDVVGLIMMIENGVAG